MVVLRLRPMSPEALLRSAENEYRRLQHHGVSVFADVQRPGESESDTIERLLDVSELGGMARADQYWVCTSAGSLLDRDFVFMKDEEPDELAEHYCVSLGDRPDTQRAGLFAAAFSRRRRGR